MRALTISRCLALALGLSLAALAPARAAVPPAEAFISTNIHKGVDILADKHLDAAARSAQFKDFLLGITDMHRIAMFSLGQYARTATPAEQDAFAAAFQDYALAVYRSYFNRYTGQTLTVTGSAEHAPGDVIVKTLFADPKDRSTQPLEVDFRVRTDGAKPVMVDFSVAGMWLAISQRDEFVSFLSKNGGNIQTLIAHLRSAAKQYH